jgi:uncharacterized protein
MVGVGYRHQLATWIEARPAHVDCLEIVADHFYRGGAEKLAQLKRHFPLFIHGLDLSLGTPGPLDQARLARFARVVELAQPDWISEHVAFTRTAEVDLGHLNPVRPTREAVALIADHAREVAERCRTRLLLENITAHLRLRGELREPDFLNEICSRADCDLLLDVTNLYINSRNCHFAPLAWLYELDRTRIRQLHVVGYSHEGERLTDAHAQPIQAELIELLQAALEYAPVEAIILERDANFPSREAMEAEVTSLRRACGRN